ncbi:hypothetical protein Sjap_008750 [Stephania japonica]|uniref:Uncharacterized protein n=1 Tax=Stephania japonica TaxID=461633 RepID=A0AAP0JQ51_9MAGN
MMVLFDLYVYIFHTNNRCSRWTCEFMVFLNFHGLTLYEYCLCIFPIFQKTTLFHLILNSGILCQDFLYTSSSYDGCTTRPYAEVLTRLEDGLEKV